MNIGIPKEIKNSENRVGITPNGVEKLIESGHKVFIEKLAGQGSGFTDKEYQNAGGIILDTAKEIWEKDLVIKVKEPLEQEYEYFYEGLILFTFLHLAANPVLKNKLVEKKVTSIAYETIRLGRNIPLLRPMSEIAGRRSVMIGSNFLEKINGGKGITLGAAPGVKPGVVTIVGGGIAGFNAAQVASGLRADVILIENNDDRIRFLDDYFKGYVKILKSNKKNIKESVEKSDLVISTVLLPGKKAPKLITEDMVKNMDTGSVIVDVAIDQGGSVETVTEVTTHVDPIRIKHGVLHYSVANIPGAVPKTATIALTNASIDYALLIANEGANSLINHEELKLGINTHQGRVVNDEINH